MNATAHCNGGETPDAMKTGAFFDLDKTIIARASVGAFRRPFRARGLLTRRGLVKVICGELIYLHLGASEQRLERLRESGLRLTKGWSQSEVSEIVQEALEEIVEPIIYAEALELIEKHHEDGHIVILVAASPEEIVVPLGRHLGADHVIASRAEVNADDRYTGAISFYAYGANKADAIRALARNLEIDLGRSYAYSDSVTDIPMLEIVGNPVAVNGDRALTRIARARSWEHREFVQPVRLSNRVRNKMRDGATKPAVTVSVGALSVVATALIIGWWIGARQNSPKLVEL